MDWREFWNADTPIYVDERHKRSHYALIADELIGLIPSPSAIVLDHGCGEALEAERVAAACTRLLLCDGAPLVRARLQARLGRDPAIAVLAPEDIGSLADASLDLVMANSLLQYLSRDELGGLLALWRAKLRPGGRLVLADVIPPGNTAVDDVRALLGFARRGGFLRAALIGLVKTAVSPYRKLRRDLGLTTYAEPDMLALLRSRGFHAQRRDMNLGPNPKRMTFVASPT